MNSNLKRIISLVLVLTIRRICASDITSQAFGTINDTIISAFGDFNSDELTDVFVRSTDGRTLEILLASEQEPLLRRSSSTKCVFKELIITSIVPGDFDGDAFMDLLITSKPKPNPNATEQDAHLLDVYINWGGSDVLNCTDESVPPLFRVIGEPVALDYNSDMIIDLFGMHENGSRVFWVFNETRQTPEEVLMILPDDKHISQLLVPHSHAYLDLNNDFKTDLFLSTESGFEIWHGTGDKGFTYFGHRQPTAVKNSVYGQSIFLDIELNGNMAQVLPFCLDKSCRSSTILAYVNGDYYDLGIDFKDDNNQIWQFVSPDVNQTSIYQDTITLRGGDFNLDGYPDLLVTLKSINTGVMQTFLMENVECNHCTDTQLTRMFAIRWQAFAPYSNGTVVGAFYDFYQDGILDVIFVRQQANGISRPVAFRNTLDYDANFVKVMVLTGLTNKLMPSKRTTLGRKQRTYGSNFPGPRIAYRTTRPDGVLQASTSAQIPQSGYFALQLPYTVLGLGRTANFVDFLTVGLSGRNRTWSLIIPNSQMVVVPLPVTNPSRWKAQLFITPSKLIWMSVISLSATCAVITLIILVLHFKERRQDRLEKLQENQPLHFDAM